MSDVSESIGTVYWPAHSEKEKLALDLFLDLRSKMSRDDLRSSWPLINKITMDIPSLITCERHVKAIPEIRISLHKTATNDFSVASLEHIVQRTVATPSARQLMVQLPVRGMPVTEFQHTKRFSDIHQQMKVASVMFGRHRYFVGDVVQFESSDNNALHGLLKELYMSDGCHMFKVHQLLRLCDIPDTIRSDLQPKPAIYTDNNLLLCWQSENKPDLHQIYPDTIMNVILNDAISPIFLLGHIT
jgi:hypothetical protein